MKSVFALGAALLVSAAAAGCGQTPITPTESSQFVFATPIGGTWSGSLLLRTVNGGECVGADLKPVADSGTSVDDGTVTVVQQGSDVSATVRSATTGLTCQYDGSASVNSFALSSKSCNAEVFYQCANGSPRVLVPLGSTLTATQNGSTATGVVATSYNVFSVDAQNERKPLTGLTTQQQFTATRR